MNGSKPLIIPAFKHYIPPSGTFSTSSATSTISFSVKQKRRLILPERLYFRKSELLFEGKSRSEVEASLLEKTSKVHYIFDLHQTSGWVLFKERQFIGKRIGEGEYLLSRYRHVLFTVLPRVAAKVKVEKR